MKTYSLTLKNKLAVSLFILAALGLGAALLLVGFALLAGLAVGGAVIGTGVALYRRLTGKHGPPLPRNTGVSGLDPSLEVFPQQRTIGDKPDDRPNTL